MNCELLRQLKQHDSNLVALSDGASGTLTYGELLDHIADTVERLNREQVQGVALCCDNSMAHVIVDLACMEATIWSLQIPFFFTAQQSSHALMQSGCSHMLSDKPQADGQAFEVAGNTLYLSRLSWRDCAGCVPGGTAKVTYTSGSTAQPKGLCLSEENLLNPVKAIHTALSPQALTSHLVVLPQSVLLESVAGVYASLYAGLQCIVPSLSHVSAAPLAGEAIRLQMIRQQVSTIILVPALLEHLVGACEQAGATPASTRFVAVGGSRVSQSLIKRARAIGLPVYEGYGLSEAGSVVSLNLPGASRAGTVGRVLSHQRITISSAREIMLHEPGFLGYCDSQSGPAAIDQHCYGTGDLGSIDSDGYLRIDGRLKNVLITSMGRNVSPEWVESELTSVAGIKQALVYGDANTMLSAIIVSTLNNPQLEQQIAMVNSRLPEYARIGDWRQADPFTVANGQLTGNGKVIRHAIISAHGPLHSNAPDTARRAYS